MKIQKIYLWFEEAVLFRVFDFVYKGAMTEIPFVKDEFFELED